MNDRDRLVDLLYDVKDARNDTKADHLIANGVAVPVRCGKCKYYEPKNSLGTQGICQCGEKEMNYGGEFYPFHNDYCSYGKRKENGDE